MNIVLIGPRGVGKSSVARALSRLCRWPVCSTDLLISYDNRGSSIPDIVHSARDGWRHFRDLEYAVVVKVARLERVIIDAGGGVVVDLDAEGAEIYSERKMKVLQACGFVVYLTGDPARLAARVALDPNRPALSAHHSEEAVMRRRDPFYRRAAHLVIDTTLTPRADLASIIWQQRPTGDLV
ncbi:MAG: shikimate kinase [Magnetococcales bacterium]|nr:shikimate kinase [Magnetococcales bacterium]